MAAAGQLPLPGTPAIGLRDARLKARGLETGLPVFIRIFKEESELELWMMKDGRFSHFATYPICHWSGTLGPKLKEGDKQAPEGFYTVSRRQMHHRGRWPKSLNLGFPNAFDRSLSRTGSYILVHGGCSSVGCYAMTNPVIEEIHAITLSAIKAGQSHVPVHVFPFRMTEDNMSRHADHEWAHFWHDLKVGYDSFERTRRAPQVSVCNGRYAVRDAASPEVGDPDGAIKNMRRDRRDPASGSAIAKLCKPPVPMANSDRQRTQSPTEARGKTPVENSGAKHANL